MASLNVPRVAMRSLSRTAPTLRSSTPRVATRCMHQKASPITSSTLQHRPRVQRWSKSATPVAATVSRRTLFIQTEPTPNADVCASPHHTYHILTTHPRLSNLIPTNASSPKLSPLPSSNTSAHARPSHPHIPPLSLRNSSTSTA
jgi:hypothetical protein